MRARDSAADYRKCSKGRTEITTANEATFWYNPINFTSYLSATVLNQIPLKFKIAKAFEN